MTPEQTEYFMAALNNLLLAASEGVTRDEEFIQLRDSELQSGLRLLWMGKESNGYVNFSHDEALILCGTSAKSTLRYHLMRLRNAGILRTYSTNGTVRAKVAGYPGSELIVHERSRTASTNSRTASTNSRMGSTDVSECSESREQHSRDRAAGQLLRAAGSRDRAAGQHYNRNFDDYPQNDSTKLVSKLDLNTPTDTGANLLTATAIDPVEHALSVAFLVSAGFWAKTAKELAGRHRFELLRRAVGFWWSNRRSNGGEFSDKPGIVLTWLANLENTVIPEKLSMDFMLSDLYMNHLTADERAGMVMVIRDDPDGQPDVERDEPAADDDLPWPEMNEYWSVALERMRYELPATTFNTWMEGSRAEFDDVAMTCKIIVDSQTKRDWLNARLRQMITREVRKSTGYNLAVTIEARRRS